MIKEDIKKELLAHQEHLIEDLTAMLDNYKSGADLDEEDVNDPEDLSHQAESTTKVYELNARIDHAKADLAFITKIPLDVMTEIGEYAVVKTNALNFIVGVAIPPFEFDNHKYVGISTKAPIYQIMKGKKKGDVFNFGKHHYEIEAVF